MRDYVNDTGGMIALLAAMGGLIRNLGEPLKKKRPGTITEALCVFIGDTERGT